jgi:hypothetical protein
MHFKWVRCMLCELYLDKGIKNISLGCFTVSKGTPLDISLRYHFLLFPNNRYYIVWICPRPH